MKVWLSFTPPSKPHTDILLHTNSATPMSRERTRKFACKGYKELTQQEYDTPHVQQITKDVYHSSGLFPHGAEKPKFILPCVFASTGSIKRCLTLTELCSLWDISPVLCKSFSPHQLLEFWKILLNPINYCSMHCFTPS